MRTLAKAEGKGVPWCRGRRSGTGGRGLGPLGQPRGAERGWDRRCPRSSSML